MRYNTFIVSSFVSSFNSAVVDVTDAPGASGTGTGARGARRVSHVHDGRVERRDERRDDEGIVTHRFQTPGALGAD